MKADYVRRYVPLLQSDHRTIETPAELTRLFQRAREGKGVGESGERERERMKRDGWNGWKEGSC